MNLFASSRLPEPEKHRYIRLIEYSLAHPEFKPADAAKACDLNEKEFRFIASSIYLLSALQVRDIDPDKKYDWVLNPEAYFSYLQYLEFRHAIETAKRAFWLSVAAIVITIIGVAIAIKA